MAQVYVNDEFQNIDIDKDLALEKLINTILLDFIKNDEVITKIEVDSLTLDLEEHDQKLSQSVSNYGRIHIFTKKSIDLAYESLDSCDEYLDYMISLSTETSQLFKANKIDAANQHFSDLTETIQLFIELVSKIKSVLYTGGTTEHQQHIQQAIYPIEIHLHETIKSLIQARQQNDIVMLYDLLEYELIDNLNKWKMIGIAQLKKLKTN